ncbi:MAG: NYN domain-containing protein [Acidobacteria bacterium]|nr:NYN domain-containing protein [Acidobacteriota bacterium]
MNNANEERLKIAVFIDFDNIAIGVKQSLGRNFDVGTVLEAIKEKGEVITKIAYGDWKRAEDFSRAMTQHAIQMVQRNLTPGGDKNGADIALALDALETAFTRAHINAFVIVGGDSDFIALVEKLKQYDKMVFVVGGRAFTSVILQKNCHEFIAYENLIGVQSGSRRSSGRTQVSSSTSLQSALPLIRRALKILSDREVSPQLGLLKSTLLQLDSTFSERDYGVSSFRDFVQKLADAGTIHLKQVDRSLLVELKETREQKRSAAESSAESVLPAEAEVAPHAAAEGQPHGEPQHAESQHGEPPEEAPVEPSLPAPEAIRALEEALRDSRSRPHWPMYLRTFKQMIRSLQPPFDEHQYGISSIYDLVRQAHRDGLLHVERNRQGILRIFPGDRFPKADTDLEPGSLPQSPDAAEDLPVRREADDSRIEALEPEPAPPVTDDGGEPLAAEPLPAVEREPETAPPAEEGDEGPEATETGAEAATEDPKPRPRTRRKTGTATRTKAAAKKTTTPRKRKSAKDTKKEEGE